MMKQTSIPLYIRFGEIPEDGLSKVHRSDMIIRTEGGVSVWRAIEDQGRYWPLLPEEPNDNTVADYFSMILDRYHTNKNVYLVTGTEMCIEGAESVTEQIHEYHKQIDRDFVLSIEN